MVNKIDLLSDDEFTKLNICLMKSELMKSGKFPNNKNRIWTMCQVTLKLVTQCIEEAEENNLTDEQFFINWEDCLNELSCKDHSNGLEEFKENLSNFYKDQN